MRLHRWQIKSLVRAAAAVLIVGSPGILASSSSAEATEIKALFPAAMRAALTQVIPAYEKSSGNKVTVEYGTVGAIIGQLKKGSAADVAVVTDKRLVDLIKQKILLTEGHAVVARVGLGVFVRKGEPKPAIGSVDQFRKVLLSSKAIVYGDPALGDSSGIAAEAIIERLGIAAEMKPKTKLVTAGAKGKTVADGDADLGFDQMSNIVINPKIESLGALPGALQKYTNYAAAIVATSKERDAGKDFIAFLRSPKAQNILKQKGFEPI
jgi:molybdate transport system substrate-binding protein